MRLIVYRSFRPRKASYISPRAQPGFCCRRSLFQQGKYQPDRQEQHRPDKPTKTGFYDAPKIAMAKQWKVVREDRNKRRKVESGKIPIIEGTSDDILQIETTELIAKSNTKFSNGDVPESTTEPSVPPPSTEARSEVEVSIVELSSTGDGLALSEDGNHVYVVPFAVPGDRVVARLYPQPKHPGPWTVTDLVKVLEPAPNRDDSLVKCKYFGECAGCQFQMLPYEAQLEHKRTIVEKAFRNFSGLSSSQIPAISDTIGSPMQYGYRTKLSPHFDGPPNRRTGGRFTKPPPVGYTPKGKKYVMDIESCPIGTDILQEGLTNERAKVARNYANYKNGATILLRESTDRTPNSPDSGPHPTPPSQAVSNIGTKMDHRNAEAFDDSIPSTTNELTTTSTGAPLLLVQTPTHTDAKTCVTDMNGFSTEYISSFKFTSRAGSFFQNNNSILPRFTSYVRTNAFPPILNPHDPPIKYLLDAYCGSGLFAVTLSSLFTSVLGIDIDPKGVEAARINAANNAIPNAGFIEADASALFADVPYPPQQTLVVIDPPRKGASEDFLQQLMQFGPKRVIYVSCNVHTQARDIGILVNGTKGNAGWNYEIESLRGFDFFPQTGHVEGVAFLNRVESVL